MDDLTNLAPERLPTHVGLILDGNRRWARKNNLEEKLGHLVGYKTLRDRLFDFFQLGIRYVTVYALSLENVRKRTPEEVGYIHKIIMKAVDAVKKERVIRKEKVRINVIGRLSLLPADVREKIDELQEFTKLNDKAFLNICIMYDGQEEIVDAVKGMIKDKIDPESINREVVKSYLYTSEFPEADFIIRTGMKDGTRISGFLLWDSSYAEFKFRTELWPEYSKDLLVEDLHDYAKRNRRMGE